MYALFNSVFKKQCWFLLGVAYCVVNVCQTQVNSTN